MNKDSSENKNTQETENKKEEIQTQNEVVETEKKEFRKYSIVNKPSIEELCIFLNNNLLEAVKVEIKNGYVTALCKDRNDSTIVYETSRKPQVDALRLINLAEARIAKMVSFDGGLFGFLFEADSEMLEMAKKTIQDELDAIEKKKDEDRKRAELVKIKEAQKALKEKEKELTK